jgi:hypothetical protein
MYEDLTLSVYKAYGVVIGTKYLGEFEADSPEEAERLAWKGAYVLLCKECCDDQCPDIHVGVFRY